MNYIDLLKKRRSVYDLNHQICLSDNELEENIAQVLNESPTGFHMQSTKIVLLMNQEHEKLWDITTNILKEIVPSQNFSSTLKKMNQFKKAKGTILFFDDEAIIQKYQNEYSLYKDNFPVFAAHGMGILQGNMWNMLASYDIGANLQHYNPLIDEKVKEEWQIPSYYQLTAQMVFGGIESMNPAKDKIDIHARMSIYK